MDVFHLVRLDGTDHMKEVFPAILLAPAAKVVREFLAALTSMSNIDCGRRPVNNSRYVPIVRSQSAHAQIEELRRCARASALSTRVKPNQRPLD